MARAVVIRAGAYADLRDISRYIAEHVSQTSADRWLTGIQSTIRLLATEAELYPYADEASAVGIDLRQALHGRRPQVYRILFTYNPDTVSVLRVRHAAQNHIAEGDV